MARRKRASMREGPLADLFRSTADEPESEPQEEQAGAEGAGSDAPTPDPSSESAYASYEESERFAEQDPAAEEPSEPPPAQEPESPDYSRHRPDLAGPAGGREPSKVFNHAPGDHDEDPPPRRDAGERISRVLSEEPVQDSRSQYGTESRGGSRMTSAHSPVIRVVGVGGGGVNAINRMVEAQIPGVEFMAVNTDLQSLQLCIADSTVHIGGEQTRGLGAGADPDLGYRAAFAEQDRIKRLLKGSDMVFVAAGAGGGTGTGAAPVVARLAREVGALTVGIITRPFSFEGTRRGKQANEGIDALGREVDTLIVVPNDRLLEVLDQQTTMIEAFQVADDVLRQGVQGISDLVTLPALINLDFADVRTIMSDAGQALLGIGMGAGDGRAEMAAEKAISSPLLETSMAGARAILLSITGGPDLSLVEVSEAAKVVNEAAHQEANIIFGANVDADLGDQIWVTVVATRFDSRGSRPSRSQETEGKRGRSSGKSGGRDADSGPFERPPRRSRRSGGGGEGGDLDVPEFLPG